MKYTIEWVYSTLKENYKSDEELVRDYKRNGVSVTIEGDSGDGWYDLLCIHNFTAESDDKARGYARKYSEDVDNEVWSLYNEKGDRLMTEEDL